MGSNVISYAEMETLKTALEEQERRKKFGGHLTQWFLDEGPFRYQAYPKHMEFFKQGANNTERLFMAANRVGKSVGGAYEATCHLTGLYPHWWEGKRFKILRTCIVQPEEAPSGFPGTVFLWEKKPVVITSDGYLALKQVQMAGKRPMDGGAFVRGRKDFVGTTVGSP